MNEIKIAIVGAGSIVEGSHLPAIQSIPHARIAWVFDKNPHRMSLIAKMYDTVALKDKPPEEALKNVDVCLLATPYGVRKPYVDACRQLGKGLVVEKPFAFSAVEHRDLCVGFKEWAIAVNFQRRYYRSVNTLTRIIQKNIFGRLLSIRFTQGNFTLKGGSGYLSSIALAGGGIIAESASHSLDIILLITKATKVTLLDLKAFQSEGLEYDAEFDSVIESEASSIPVHCSVSTLRNLDNGLFLEFENVSLKTDLSPDGRIFLREGANNQVEFSLTEESLSIGAAQATKINEAFFAFWEQYLAGWQEQRANQTSAYQSLLTSSWLGEIYNKIRLP